MEAVCRVQILVENILCSVHIESREKRMKHQFIYPKDPDCIKRTRNVSRVYYLWAQYEQHRYAADIFSMADIQGKLQDLLQNIVNESSYG